MRKLKIREIKQKELSLLQDFLYEAIFKKDEKSPLSKKAIKKPELKVYIEDFGQEDDNCLVAEVNDKIVGAVWSRIFKGDIKGFGYIDDQTPELAISLYKGYRNQGIGTKLMKNMIELLKEKGYNQISLSVQKDNYAVKMYEKFGFEVEKELDEEYIMVCEL